MKPYVTIVVPFWNAATTLSNCIDSVLNQTRNDWELILVDDGSVDDGYKICAQYAEKDNRIRLLCRDHEGVGAARNAAMDETQGNLSALWMQMILLSPIIWKNFVLVRM